MLSVRKFLSKIYHIVLNQYDGVSYYFNDMRYFMRWSNLGSKGNSEANKRASMTATYHIIEKGLSMPNRRLGFGREKLLSLIKECQCYYDEYGMNNQLEYAISIVKEYDELHKTQSFKLDVDLQKKIDELLSRFPQILAAHQESFTKEEFFAQSSSPFDLFSNSRHSMRHFCGEIPISEIEKAIDLAKNAPSACNKQPVRLYVVKEKGKVKNVLDLQQGNRGFGENIDKVIIITTQFTGCTRYSERYMPFMDAGIFSMNLLYALHFYHIGAIPLVWLNSKKRDSMLRNIVSIPEEEIPAIIVGVGDVSDTVICAKSPRLETKELFMVK